jgi:hypothetical protein
MLNAHSARGALHSAGNQFDTGVPFGGYKQSGIGREKGQAAMEHYTQVGVSGQRLQKHASMWLGAEWCCVLCLAQTKAVYTPMPEPVFFR